MIRVLEVSNQTELSRILREIGVDPYGIGIMRLKGMTRLIHIKALSNITANILKQEMLALGADAAIARDSLTGKTKRTDCLLMANGAQLNRLNAKLKNQPFGLGDIANLIQDALLNYEKDNFLINIGGHRLDLSKSTRVMGVVNLTPDSFSGDGLFKARFRDEAYILDYTGQLVKDGADIIDIGGESSRPGAKPISIKEECSRVMPAIKVIAKKIKIPISIDTYKPEVAARALINGAGLVNDISGLRNPAMVKLVARYKAAVVIMHMKGKPSNMQKKPVYRSLIFEIMEFLENRVANAVSNGITRDKIIIDPGIGFGKTLRDNLEILKNLQSIQTLGRPILVGPSRKSFIGKILHSDPQDRMAGTLSACVLAAKNGARILRAHDVKEVKQALKILDAVSDA